jgi:hypothetical protein
MTCKDVLPTQRDSHLNKVGYEEKVAVKFETELFTKKKKYGIILGDMNICAIYLNPQYSQVHYNGVLL